MRLVWKLTAGLVAGMFAVLAVYGTIRVRMDLEGIETDLQRHQAMTGRVLGAALATVWRVSGEEAALEVLETANQRDKEVSIRWVWLDGEPGRTGSQLTDGELARALRGERFSLVRDHGVSGTSLYTYVPVRVPRGEFHEQGSLEQDGYSGAIELSQALAGDAQRVRSTIVWVFLRMAFILAVCALIAMVLGALFVGRPVQSLIDLARRIGAGDLSGRLNLRQRDELGDLASEMNGMCDRLAEAQQRIVSETTARIAALDQLRHSERLSMVGKLSSGIAHELGTPLNVALVRTKLVAGQVVSGSEAVENARIAVSQLERMTNIIRQLLNFARRSNPRKERKDLRLVLQQTVEFMATIADKHGVALELEKCEEAAPAQVDAGQVQQALANLLLNAVQASPAGAIVRLGMTHVQAVPPAGHERSAGAYLRIDVIDEGAGIAPDVLDRVFEPFFTTKDVGEGTGLGLSVSYGIVVEHGGWIDAASEAGRGSRFSIFLPRDPEP